VAVQLVVSRDQRRPQHYLPKAAMDIDRPGWSNTKEAKTTAFVEPGYYPAGTGGASPAAPDRAEPERWTTSDAHSHVMPRTVADHRIELDVQTRTGTAVVLASRSSPSWSVSLDGREVIATSVPPRGFLRVEVPPGRHRLKAELEDTELRRVANSTTLASAALLVLLVVVGGPAARVGLGR
jgi:hypothetical protein